MGWTIDRSVVFGGANGTPRYELIASAIEAAVDRGDLRPGERLPTVRALARDLGVSSASVAVAYRLLERHGRADAQVGRGTFVRAFVAGSGQPSSTSHHHAPSDGMPRRADVTPVSLATSWRR